MTELTRGCRLIREPLPTRCSPPPRASPVVLLLTSGGMVSVNGLIDSAGAIAIVEAFNPGQQGPVALGQLLLGAENPVGEDAMHRVRRGVRVNGESDRVCG